MRQWAEYHTHTNYSDGKGSIEDNVKAALKVGLKRIGISDHGPGHLYYGISRRKIERMRSEVERLGEQYPEIEILLGVEANILDDKGNIDLSDKYLPYFDYVLAGYHFGSVPTSLRGLHNHFRNFIKRTKMSQMRYNTKALVEAMKNNDLFVLTHPGDKGLIDIGEVAETAVKTGTVLEINEHHKILTLGQLQHIKHLDLKYVVSSDAHRPQDIGKVPYSMETVRLAQLNPDSVINIEHEILQTSIDKKEKCE